MQPIPFLLSEIHSAEYKADNEAKIGDYVVDSFYFYGFVKRKFEGKPAEEEGKFDKPPMLVLTDEDAEIDVVAKPKPWENELIQKINVRYQNDMVIVKGSPNWYKDKSDNWVMSVNIDSLISVPEDRLDGIRRLFLMKIVNARLGDVFPKKGYFYNFIKSNRDIPLKEFDDTFAIDIPMRDEVITILKSDEEEDVSEPDAEEEDIDDLFDLDFGGEEKKERKKKKVLPKRSAESREEKKNEPKRETKKARKEIDRNTVAKQVVNFIKKNGKVSISDIQSKFKLDEGDAWTIAIKARKLDKQHIEVDDRGDETYLIYKE